MLKLATTSFIKPADRLVNATFLENRVDEVELLYFDSKTTEDVPDPSEILQLSKLDLTYNIHMPIDRDLTEKSAWVDLFTYADILSPLSPTTYTFHPYRSTCSGSPNTYLDNLVAFSHQYSNVTVENVDSDLSLFDQLSSTPIQYCLDIGHALISGVDPISFIHKWGHKISHIHCHGVVNGKDHFSLSHLDRSLLIDIIQFAHGAQKTLCIEVFNETAFDTSMSVLRRLCEEYNYTDYGWCQ